MVGDRTEEMTSWLQRTELLIGDAMKKLAESSVAVFGVGGVGSFATEALVRSGVGRLVLVDADVVSESNRNRQLPALISTLGEDKVAVMAARIRDINPQCRVETRKEFYLPTERPYLADLAVDYVVDAIDTVAAKVGLIVEAQQLGIPLISAMGTGNKLHPEKLCLTDIYQTHTCPLAKVMRRELRKAGVPRQLVVYSEEEPRRPQYRDEDERVPGSIAFVPPVAGMIMAGVVVRHLTEME